MVLVNGFDAWIASAVGDCAISSQRYTPGTVSPDGASRLEAFEAGPWPRWRYRIDAETCVELELFAVHGRAEVALIWRVTGTLAAGARLGVRLFFSVRDFHFLQHENPVFRFEPEQGKGRVTWRPYPEAPAVTVRATGDYEHAPEWYRNFLYTEDEARGLDCTEDLASPGVFWFDIAREQAMLVLSTEAGDDLAPAADCCLSLRDTELARRAKFTTPLDRAADAYLAKRGEGGTLLAGFPWFGDWGRDTFVAIRGLCIATGRLGEARQILLEWAENVSRGMLPNRFPDRGSEPEFNSVDASLWYVIAVGDYLDAAGHGGGDSGGLLRAAVEAILTGYSEGTRFNIHASEDGLLAAGEPGEQLTWMDARVDGREITPRIGKPVEVQALWLNSLAIGARFSPHWNQVLAKGLAAFERGFWSEEKGHLADVIDCDHHAGVVDLTFRPNQIFAVGGLPLQLLSPPKARAVVDAVERRLLTPLGLRSLAPDEPGYHPRYEGGPAQRDAGYHQGAVWPWLIGPFVEAWVRVRGGTDAARAEARARFLPPLIEHLKTAGIGHISEIADGDAPHTPRGCPFQAWSLGEFLRLDRSVLRPAAARFQGGSEPKKE